MDWIVRIAIVALIGGFLWLIFRPRHAITIVMDAGGVKSHKGLPKRHERKVLEFLERHVATGGPLVIYADRRRGGLRLQFRGDIAPGTQQQIRNFFLAEMEM
jgi:hypothetical protein